MITGNIFPQRMREYRYKSGLNQKTLAEKLGVNRVTYIYYETGKREPGISFLSAFSKLSGLTTDYLLGLSENKSPDKNAQLILSVASDLVETVSYQMAALGVVREKLLALQDVPVMPGVKNRA